MDFGARCLKMQERQSERARERERERQREKMEIIRGSRIDELTRKPRMRLEIIGISRTCTYAAGSSRCSEKKFGASRATRRRGRKRAEYSNKTGNRRYNDEKMLGNAASGRTVAAISIVRAYDRSSCLYKKEGEEVEVERERKREEQASRARTRATLAARTAPLRRDRRIAG